MNPGAVVVDTHAWLWWNNDAARLSEQASEAIDASEAVGVSAVSCWELAMLAEKGRIVFPHGAKPWIRRALARPGVIAIPLEPEAAADAALLEAEMIGSDPADRMIYATARSRGARLVTADRRIRAFDPRGTIW